ncbi:hypothetical protein AB6A40_008309 [Gnathostoma spinigerum]|uniref:TPM domain-containing protein n=1 Tax=Gnathostoma spinigerum TaxID=75299 RepID=A0ABD6EZ85_9BILA
MKLNHIVHPVMIILISSLVTFTFIVCSADDLTAYPNPKKSFRECNMRSFSSVCDPDKILTEAERYRLNNDIVRLAARSSSHQGDFCQKRGIEAILAVTRKGSEQMAKDLNERWNLDEQCKKSVIFVLSADDRKLYYSGKENTELSDAEFKSITESQQKNMEDGHFREALTNIFKEIGEKNAQKGGVTGNKSGPRAKPTKNPLDNGCAHSQIFASWIAVVLYIFTCRRILIL